MTGISKKAVTAVDVQDSLKIDINHASLLELDKLPSVGIKTAQAIIEYRKTHGYFRSVEDLKKIRGIGEKKLNIMRKFIFIEGE